MKIKDLATGQIFEYGSNCHHSLRISQDGRTLSFENLQNGDGSKYGEYRFVDDNEENTPDEIESEYSSECYFNIGGFGNRCKMKEFVEKLTGRLKERIEENYGWEEDDFFDGQSNAFGWTIDIINKLAEEYSADTSQKSANGWISCSERLPEGNDDVMVIYTDNDGEVDICCLDWFLAYSDTMLAWMPLPEPYKPQQEFEWKNKVMKHFTNVE